MADNKKVQEALEAYKKRRAASEKSEDNSFAAKKEASDSKIQAALKAREARIAANAQNLWDDIRSRSETAVKSYNDSISSPFWGKSVTDIYDSQRSNMIEVSNLMREAEAYRKYFGDEATDSLIESLKGVKSGQDSIYSSAGVFSQFKSEDDYDEYRFRSSSDNSNARQQRYQDNQKRIAELKVEMDNAADIDWTDNRQRMAYYQREKEIKAEISRLETDMRNYERGNENYVSKTVDDYNKVTLNDDFYTGSANRNHGNPTREELTEYDALTDSSTWYYDEKGILRDAYGNEITKDSSGNWVNSKAQEYAVTDRLGIFLSANEKDLEEYAGTIVSGTWGNIIGEGIDGSWNQLTKNEIDIYYYLLNTSGQGVADKYLTDMKTELNRRETMSDIERWNASYDEASFLEKIALNAATVPAKFFSNITGSVENAAMTIRGEDINPYSFANRGMHFSQTVRGATAEELDDTGFKFPVIDFTLGDIYQTGMSRLDSLLATKIFGGGGTVFLGMGAAQDEAYRLYKQGASPEQITLGSLAAGAAEAIWEYLSFGKLEEIKEIGNPGEWIKSILIQGYNEMTEEAATEISNIISNALIMGSQSDLAELYKENEEDAFATFLGLVKQTAQAGFGGLLGGLGAGFTQSTGAYIDTTSRYRDAGRPIMYAEGGVDALKNLANEVAGVSDTKMQKDLNKQAGNVSGETATGKNIIGKAVAAVKNANNATKIGRLFATVQTANNQVNATANKADIKKSLMRKGFTYQTATDIAEALVASYNGQELTKAQIKLMESVENSKVVQDAISNIVTNEQSTMGQRSQKIRDFNSDVRAGIFSKDTGVSLDVAKEFVKGNINAVKESLAENQYEVSAEGKTIDKNGNDVVITGVESIEGGKLILKTENGTIDASDVAFATKDEAFVYSAVANMDVSAASAWAIIKGFNQADGVSAQLYAIDIPLAYKYGKLNYKAGLQNLSLTPGQSAMAFQMGRDDAAVEATEQAGTEATIIDKNAEKKIIFEGFTYNKKNAKDIQKASMAAIDMINKMSNLEVHVYKSYKKDGKLYAVVDGKERLAPNGYFTDGNKIYIDFNAGNQGEGLMLYTLSHEIGHYIAKWNAQDFKAISDFLFEHYGKNVPIDKLLEQQKNKLKNSYKADGKPVPSDSVLEKEAQEELVCDMLSRMLADKNAYDKLMELKQKDLSLFQKLGQVIKNILDKLGKLIGVYDTQNPDFMYAASVENFGEEAFRQLQDLYMRAFVQADANYQSSLTPGEEGVVVNENGDPVAYSTDDGSVLLSMRTYDEEGRKALREYLKKCVSSKKLTKAEMQEMIDGIEDIYEVCKEFKDKYAPFSSWSDAAVVRDTYGKPVFSVVTPNGDYKMNLDFSLVCKKRRTLDAVFNEMSKRGIIDDFELGQKSVVKINEIIRRHGLETACALCFVDAKRFRQASMADQFTSLYNELVLSLVPEDQRSSIDHFNFSGYETIKKVEDGIHTWDASKLDFSHLNEVMKNYGSGTVEHKAAKYIKAHAEGRRLLLRGDFMSSQGFDAVKTQNKDILKLYNSKKGTGGPKAAFGDVQYMNEIIKKARTWTPAKAYAVGGVRIQSFSDYVPRMVFDYVQMIYDLAATNLPAHAYTKEALFVKQFGLTGVKINMSLIPAIAEGGIAPGLDANGNYVWAGESFDFETAKEIQNAEGYTENCGTICVGVSDRHIRKLLSDPDIRMVIPYHKSGLNPIVAHMNKIAEFSDYTNKQNTTVKATGAKAEKHFDFNKALHYMGENADPTAVIQQYFDWCDDNGYDPKFADFRDHPNYYKLIEDFTLYDKDGKYVPQREVRAVFPKEGSAFGSMKDLIKAGLEEDAIIEGKKESSLSSIVDEIQKTLPRTEAEISEEQVEQADRDLEADTRHSDRDLSEDPLYPVTERERSAFNRMYIDKTNGLKRNKERDIIINTHLYTYHVRAVGRSYKSKPFLGEILKKVPIDNAITVDDVREEVINGTYRATEEDYIPYEETPYVRGRNDRRTPSLRERLAAEGYDYLLDEPYEGETQGDRGQGGRNRKSDEVKLSDRDSDYLAAVNRGDMKTAQKMVDAAAMNMPNIFYRFKTVKGERVKVPQTLWHYSREVSENGKNAFTVFNVPAYFSKNQDYASYMFRDGFRPDFEKGQKAKPFYITATRQFNMPNIYGRRSFDGKFYMDRHEFLRGLLNENEMYHINEFVEDEKIVHAFRDAGYDLIYDKQAGYDTYIVLNANQIKSADPVTYDDSGNVIPLSERFNPGNDDIRYSDRDTEYEDGLLPWEHNDVETIEGESIHDYARRGELENYKGDYKPDLVERMFLEIINDEAKTRKKEELARQKLLAEYEQKLESLWDSVDQYWFGLFGEYCPYYGSNDSTDIIRTTVRRSDGWRKEAKILLQLTQEIDKVNQDIATLEDEAASQVLYQDRDTESVSNRSLLANALEGAAKNDIERSKIQEYKGKIDLINSEERKLSELNKKIKELSFAKGPRDTNAIRDLQFEARQTANRINTYDKQLLRLEASKPLQDVLTREKKMAYQRAEKKGKEALEAYRERTMKTQRELLEKWQESRKKGIEGRHKTAMRHKIKDIVNELNQYLLRGTKDRHVPIELQKAVAEALNAVNMDTVGAEERIAKLKDELLKAKTPEQIQEISRKIDHIQEMGDKMNGRLQKLKDAYDQFVNSDDPLIANSHDEVISSKLQSVIDSIGNTPLRDMTLAQLEDVYDMYRMVLTTVRNTNKAFKAKKSESISIIANRVMEEVEKVGGKKKQSLAMLNGIKSFGWNNLKPVYAFEHIGSDSFTEVFNNVRAGEDVWAVDVTEAREFYLDKSKKHNYDSWDFKKQYKFTSTSGMDFELSLEQIMSLYAYSKREQAADHLKKGGIVIDESTEITVKTKLGIPVKFNPTEATAYNISDETLADIISKLTDEQKGFVDEMQDYLSTVMGAKGNEVSLEMYGIKLFKEKFYFPLKSAHQFMAKAKEQAQGEAKIKNSGFSKETVQKASNPIVLTPFMNVWSNHVNEMSMYHAFVLPMEDFYRVYNYKTPTSDTMATESVEMFIQNAYGKGATKYIDQLLKDLNGGARTDQTTGIINKMMGLFKKGAVFASLSVVVQQPAAIARAAALVDTKYFIGPKVDHKRHKALWDEVKQYAPVAIIKEMGYFDTNMGKSTQDFILGKEYSGFSEKMKALVTDSGYRDEVLSKAPALADELAWCSIWEAVKRETKDKYPGLDVNGEPFLKLAGSRFTEVITKTQVYDSVLSRSALMRSKDTGMKMATAFMAEPTTSINMIADALLQSKRGNKKYARAAIGAVIASQILNSILVSFVYAGRDDDEDETYVEKYIGTLTGEVWDSLNPLTYIPFIKDIVSIVQGYDVERSDMAVISDLWSAWQKLSKDNVSTYRKVEGFAGSIAQIFGLPVKNIMRDVRGIYQTIMSFVNGQQTTPAGIGYAVKSALPKWIGGGDVSNQNQLYEAYLSGDDAHLARVVGRYKDESAVNSAMRSAIKAHYTEGDISSETAMSYLVEYAGMEEDDAYWKLQEWEYENNSEDEFGKYDKFHEAVETGKNLKAVIKEYTDNGVEMKTLKSNISSYYRQKYIEMSSSEKAGIKGYLLNAFELCGYDRADAADLIAEWEYESNHPELVGKVTYSQYKRWQTDGKPRGVSIELFTDVTEYRDDGTSGSVKSQEEVAEYINSLPISVAQKDALWCCFWKESTLKNAPWH